MSRRRERTVHCVSRALTALGFVGILVFCSCEPTIEEETAALLATDIRFAGTSRENGMAEAFFRFMAPDGMLLRPSVDPVRGPHAIKERLSGQTGIILTWTPKGAEVSRSRDLGYTWGTYAVEKTDPSGPLRLGTGKYLNVWRKQPDGTWKVLVDIGNEDRAAGPAAKDE